MTAPTTNKNQVGGLYSCQDGEGGYCICKILAIDENMVHVRLYKNTYASRPKSIDPSELAIGTIQETDNFGIGHLPLTEEEFKSWKPELLAIGLVHDDGFDGGRVDPQPTTAAALIDRVAVDLAVEEGIGAAWTVAVCSLWRRDHLGPDRRAAGVAETSPSP